MPTTNPDPELPYDLDAATYRRHAQALVQLARETGHGPTADRLMAAAQVYATCALSAPAEQPSSTSFI